MSRTGVLPEDLLTRVEGLRHDRTPFVLATVVRAERPTSARPGDRAVVLPDGTIEGFVGGVCAESTVRLEGLRLLRDGTSTLLRISPSGGDDDGGTVAGTASPVEGLITVDNPCLSGGTLEIFLEAMVPPTVVVILGDGPVARALEVLGSALDYDVRTTSGSDESLPDGAAAVIVASHGRGEEPVLTRALRAGVPYVALVASRRRGAAVLDGLDVGDRQRVRTPAGLDIGARTPPEVALAIYAEIVATRAHRVWSVSAATDPAPPTTADAAAEPFAVDPVCGMAVACVPASPSAVVGGTTHWFCGLGCRQAFLDPARDDVPSANGAR